MMLVCLSLTLLLPTPINFVQSASAPALPAYEFSKPTFKSTCGGLVIPYPLGTAKGCYLENRVNSFLITCNDTQPYLALSSIEVSSISLDGQIRILENAARTCYNRSGDVIYSRGSSIRLSKFPVNNTRNKLTAIGCSTFALIRGHRVQEYTTGCASQCASVDSVVDGSCSGIGCCQTSLPRGARDFQVVLQTFRDSGTVLAKIPCSSAFVVEEGAYNFSSSDLTAALDKTLFPVVLDWAVGTETCAIAQKNLTSYACVAPNSTCTDSIYGRGTGYQCNCPSGFEGNPYLSKGCIDINECETLNPCDTTAICKNKIGGFSCDCPDDYRPDGKKGCRKISRAAGSGIAIGVSTSLFVLVVGSSWIYWLLAKRKHIKQKEMFFMQNGGSMLREELSKHNGLAETARIFTEEDLKKATSNYDELGIIGRGGFGTVYKGVLLPNNREVAIKKSKVSDQSQISQFINEVIILSQINHVNVVKLIGCCLETEVPLLVYEFINNSTLSEHIHGKDDGSYFSWEMCLKIAAEIAGAIAYLHSAASPPIIHRDIKSTNILLDDNFVAKVADFGASKLVPRDHTEIATLVQGTFGYMDPEYFHSSQLTEKSDVYSFGVLLAELLTGERAVCFDRPEKDRNLAMYFISSMKIGNGMPSIVQKCLLNDEENIEQIKKVVMVAARCLNVTGDKRPSMKEVAMELEGLKTKVEHPWVDKDPTTDHNETEYLLKQSLLQDALGSTSFGYSSIAGFDNLSVEMTRKVQLR